MHRSLLLLYFFILNIRALFTILAFQFRLKA